MKTTDVLQKASAAVSAVEQKLTELGKLTNDAKELADSIEAAKQSESEILASQQKESAKLKKLLELKTTVEIRLADEKKLKADIAASEEEVIALGSRANLWLGALRDALISARKQRIGGQVKSLFVPQAKFEIDRLLPYLLAVREIDSLDSLFFAAHKVELSLASCRKIRPTFDALRGMAESEPELVEVVAGADW
jgi:hypothetical protein